MVAAPLVAAPGALPCKSSPRWIVSSQASAINFAANAALRNRPSELSTDVNAPQASHEKKTSARSFVFVWNGIPKCILILKW